jgi:hypothetical protein
LEIWENLLFTCAPYLQPLLANASNADKREKNLTTKKKEGREVRKKKD